MGTTGSSTSKAENGKLKKEVGKLKKETAGLHQNKAALLEKIAELEGNGGGQAPSKGKKKKQTQKQPSAEEGEQVFASFHDDGKDGLIVVLKKENAEQKAIILTLESKLAAKVAGVEVLFDGAKHFVGKGYSEGCKVARLLFPKAERMRLEALAALMDVGLEEMVAGMIAFYSNKEHWVQHKNASYGMVISNETGGGAATCEKYFLGAFKGKGCVRARACVWTCGGGCGWGIEKGERVCSNSSVCHSRESNAPRR
jgi:hypothetical protein